MPVKTKNDRVIMYSVEEGGMVVTHHLPWARGSEKFEALKARGFTFEKPDERVEISPTVQDKRLAGLGKARAAKAAKKQEGQHE